MNTKSKMKIGLLGGTFNPIHRGHTHIARAAVEALGLSQVLFIPSGTPPHKSTGLASAQDRLAMVRLAIQAEPGFEACDFELHREGLSYTIDTVDEIRNHYGSDPAYYFLIGADSIPELPSWRGAKALLLQCTFVALSRPGEPLTVSPEAEATLGAENAQRLRQNALTIEGVDVSSTTIRNQLAAGKPVTGMIAPNVLAYIRMNRLYGAPSE